MRSSGEDEVSELEMKLLRPPFRTDVSFLGSVLDDDFVECGASGKVFGRAEVLEWLPDEGPVEFAASDLTVRTVSPDVIHTRFTVEKKTSDGVRTSHRSSIWHNVDGKWKMLYHQGR